MSPLFSDGPVLADNDQQRPEPTRNMIEILQLTGYRIRIAKEIDARLGKLVKGNFIAGDWQLVIGVENPDKAACLLKAKLVVDRIAKVVGAKRMRRSLPCVALVAMSAAVRPPIEAPIGTR
jgi:hypothetical protein